MGTQKELDEVLTGMAIEILLQIGAIEECMAGGVYHDTEKYSVNDLDTISIQKDDWLSDETIRRKLREFLRECPTAPYCPYCHSKDE